MNTSCNHVIPMVTIFQSYKIQLINLTNIQYNMKNDNFYDRTRLGYECYTNIHPVHFQGSGLDGSNMFFLWRLVVKEDLIVDLLGVKIFIGIMYIPVHDI